MTKKVKLLFGAIIMSFSFSLRAYAAGKSLEVSSSNIGRGLFENLLLILLAAVVIYVFFIRPGRTVTKKALMSKTVQELLFYKEITPDGLIVLPDGKYRRMVEVYPTNLVLKSSDEQANCWVEYRNTIDTLSVDWTKIIQSRIMRISDYLDEQMQEAEKLKGKYPLLYEHEKQVISELRNEYEEKEKRERRYYVILKIDAEDFLEADSSFGVDNAAVGALFSTLGFNKKKYSDEELRNVATSELENAAALLAAGLYRSGVVVRLLNKKDILDYLNNTLCRELAPVQNIDLMDRAGVFHFSPASVTVDLFLSKEAVRQAVEQENMNGSGEKEFFYEDEIKEEGKLGDKNI